MKLEADIDAELVVKVEDRPPALGEFLEGGVDEAGRARRPRVEERPGERAGEGDVRVEAEIAARSRRELDLLGRPFLACLGVAAHLRRGESVERVVKDGIDRDQLALQMGRELGDLDPVLGGGALQLVAIGLALRGLLEVDEARVPGRDLHALVAERRRPAADRIEGVERRLVADELREEDRRSLDRFHCFYPVPVRVAQAFAHCLRRKSWPNW